MLSVPTGGATLEMTEGAVTKIHEVAPQAILIAKPNAGKPRVVGRDVVLRRHAGGYGGVRPPVRRAGGTGGGRLLWLDPGAHRRHCSSGRLKPPQL